MTDPTPIREAEQPEPAVSDPVALLKALLDEGRLAILGLAAQRPCTLAELAEALPGRRTPLAKHIAQLCAIGLLAVDGDRYVLDVRNLQAMKRVMFARPSAPVAEGSEEQILATFVRAGKMIQYPAQQSKRLVLLRWLAAQFREGQTYTEPEVNELLNGHSEDFATLRRFLVDAGLLERHNSIYRRPEQDGTGDGR